MDFDRWMSGQGKDAETCRPRLLPSERRADEARVVHERELQDSGTAWQMGDSSWWCECCRCGEDFELPCDTMDVYPGQDQYCGGSPRCCP